MQSGIFPHEVPQLRGADGRQNHFPLLTLRQRISFPIHDFHPVFRIPQVDTVNLRTGETCYHAGCTNSKAACARAVKPPENAVDHPFLAGVASRNDLAHKQGDFIEILQLCQPQYDQRRTDNHAGPGRKGKTHQAFPPVIRSPDHRDRVTAKHRLLHNLAQASVPLLREADQNRIHFLDQLGKLPSQIGHSFFLCIRLRRHSPEDTIYQHNHIQLSV